MARAKDELVLLHNPRCSKSRALKEALEARGAAFVERRYLDQPLGRAELADLSRKLGLPAARMVRSKEPEYAAEGLTARSTDAQLLAAIARSPKLLERPILIRGERAAIGRPDPRAALALLD